MLAKEIKNKLNIKYLVRRINNCDVVRTTKYIYIHREITFQRID